MDVVLFCTFDLSDHQWLEVVSSAFGPDVAAIGKDFCDHMHRGDVERLQPRRLRSVRENPPAGQTTSTAKQSPAREVIRKPLNSSDR